MPSRGNQGGATYRYVKVEGVNELRQSLKKIEDDFERKRLQQTLKAEFRDAGNIVAQAARHRAPLGPKRAALGPGALRDTIRVQGALRGVKVMAGGIRGVKYAGPIEYGWPTRPNKAKGWRGGPITKSRFLGRALYARRDAIRDRMERAVADVAEQVKGA